MGAYQVAVLDLVLKGWGSAHQEHLRTRSWTLLTASGGVPQPASLLAVEVLLGVLRG